MRGQTCVQREAKSAHNGISRMLQSETRTMTPAGSLVSRCLAQSENKITSDH